MFKNVSRKIHAIISGKILSYRYDQRAKMNTRSVDMTEVQTDESTDSEITKTEIVVFVARESVARIVKRTIKIVMWIRLNVARLIVAMYIVYLMSALFPVNPEASY